MVVGALCGAGGMTGARAAEPIELTAPAAERPTPPMRRPLFISPAGEPFRATGSESPLATWFSQADLNSDGVISLEEFTADHLRFFALLDQDHDGVIAGLEVTRYEHEIAPEILSQFDRAGPGGGGMRPPRGGPGDGGPGGGPPGGGRPHGRRGSGGQDREEGFQQGAARFGLLKEAEPVRAADADMDFRVTLSEWRKAAASRLRKLDTNGDGALDLAELQAQAPRGPEARRRPRP